MDTLAGIVWSKEKETSKNRKRWTQLSLDVLLHFLRKCWIYRETGKELFVCVLVLVKKWNVHTKRDTKWENRQKWEKDDGKKRKMKTGQRAARTHTYAHTCAHTLAKYSNNKMIYDFIANVNRFTIQSKFMNNNNSLCVQCTQMDYVWEICCPIILFFLLNPNIPLEHEIH